MSTTQPSINENLQQDGANKSKKGGLEGIVAATTALSKVEGTAGRLIYRGYNIHDLARTTSFEEIAHLLWFGHLPDKEELLDLKIRLLADRTMPDAMLRILRELPATTEPMDVLRTVTSAWGAINIKGKPTVEGHCPDSALPALSGRLPTFAQWLRAIRVSP